MITLLDKILLTNIITLFYLLFNNGLLFGVFFPHFLEFPQDLGLVVFVLFC